ncbi:MAG: hypothetical protein JWQ29_2022 [Phenylobacterium sp.]|nr:hypothetical protein [Phenylobacterium sp.]
MFDFLLSADMMVSDPDKMAALLVDKLGIYGHPNWRQAFDNHPYIAHFLRVHKSLAMAPTRIEPQGHLDLPNPGDPMFHDFLESLKAYQGEHRPMLTHSIVLVAPVVELSALIERLYRRRQPFRLAQRTPELPFDRLWVGVTPEQPYYEPSVDGGLCIEVIATEPTRMPAEAFANPPPEPVGFKDGEMVRVTARGFIVRDLDDTLARCSANLDLEPSGEVEQLRGEGYRRARMGFRLPHSAFLDVVEPTRWDSDTGLYLHNWGPGPHFTRIAVVGLAAKAEELKSKGVKHTWIEESDAVGGRPLIKVDPAELEGQVFEFEEYTPSSATA